MGRSEYKVPGGKLLRARAESREGLVTFVQVTGDFFMTPEDDLEDLEKMLMGAPVDANTISRIVCSFFAERCTVITGASPEDFVRIILNALAC